MAPEERANLQTLLEEGALEELSERLAPYLAQGDLDARYLNCLFSIDPAETNDIFDARRMAELKALAAHWYAPALYDLAWAYRFGDVVPQDSEKFVQLLSAAALQGFPDAPQLLAAYLEMELDADGLQDKLADLPRRR